MKNGGLFRAFISCASCTSDAGPQAHSDFFEVDILFVPKKQHFHIQMFSLPILTEDGGNAQHRLDSGF